MAKQQIKPPKDEDLMISDRIFSLAAWLWTLGWLAVVVGVFALLVSEGKTPGLVIAASALPAFITARLLDGFALMVEKSVITQRTNSQIVNQLGYMQQQMDRWMQMDYQQRRMDDQQYQPEHRQRRADRRQPADYQEQDRVDDVFAKYSEENEK